MQHPVFRILHRYCHNSNYFAPICKWNKFCLDMSIYYSDLSPLSQDLIFSNLIKTTFNVPTKDYSQANCALESELFLRTPIKAQSSVELTIPIPVPSDTQDATLPPLDQ